MAKTYPTSRLYKLSNGSAQGWIYAVKSRGMYLTLYRFYSSRTAAVNGMKYIQWLFPGTKEGRRMIRAKMIVAKTEKGWGVFQSSPHKQYQITERNVGKYLIK